MAKKPIKGKPAQRRISEKIHTLLSEGKPRKQAIGQAYGMERSRRKKAGKKK